MSKQKNHKKRKFKLVNSAGDYDFYAGTDDRNRPLYNIIPKGDKIPTGGYYDKDYISNIKGVDGANFPPNITIKESDALICDVCGKPRGEHTGRELGEHDHAITAA